MFALREPVDEFLVVFKEIKAHVEDERDVIVAEFEIGRALRMDDAVPDF